MVSNAFQFSYRLQPSFVEDLFLTSIVPHFPPTPPPPHPPRFFNFEVDLSLKTPPSPPLPAPPLLLCFLAFVIVSLEPPHFFYHIFFFFRSRSALAVSSIDSEKLFALLCWASPPRRGPSLYFLPGGSHGPRCPFSRAPILLCPSI